MVTREKTRLVIETRRTKICYTFFQMSSSSHFILYKAICKRGK